ncbi:hypothetical protein DMI69_25685 [Escherichia coli]|nr:hypothetical protein [Escherichia coli]
MATKTSVFIQAGGSYRLTPFYDIISAFPVLAVREYTAISNWQWGLTHPKAKKRQSIKFIRDISGDSKGAEIPGSADA